MEFFKQLSEISGNLDLTIRIMSRGDSITLSILPATTDKIQPLTITGTADELDAGLMEHIRRPLGLVAGLTSNAAEFEATVSKEQKGTKKAESKTKDLTKAPEATQPELAPTAPAAAPAAPVASAPAPPSPRPPMPAPGPKPAAA